MQNNLTDFFNAKVAQYNQTDFIKDDPICVPHRFTKLQDIEVAGFFAAIFAWGIRTTIINKSNELLKLMDDAPYDFVINHQPHDLKKLLVFKHRTFNTTDLLYFIHFLQYHYHANTSLESAFTKMILPNDETIENGLIGFHQYFFSLEDYPL